MADIKMLSEIISEDVPLNLVEPDIYNLPFQPESFDHIFVCFVLEHLPRPGDALNRLKNLAFFSDSAYSVLQ